MDPARFVSLDETGTTPNTTRPYELAIDDCRSCDHRSGRAHLQRLGGPSFFVQPALEAMCRPSCEPGGRAPDARGGCGPRPDLRQGPARRLRLLRAPEDLIDRFMVGLRKAGLVFS
jgi:hypothetical protein